MARIPEEASDDTINRLFEDELKPAIAAKASWDRLEEIMNQPRVPTLRELREAERRRHLEQVQREVNALRLTEIDPDWRTRFIDQAAAERFYWAELAEYETISKPPKQTRGRLVNLGNPESPPEWIDDDVTFDDDLEDRDER